MSSIFDVDEEGRTMVWRNTDQEGCQGFGHLLPWRNCIFGLFGLKWTSPHHLTFMLRKKYVIS